VLAYPLAALWLAAGGAIALSWSAWASWADQHPSHKHLPHKKSHVENWNTGRSR